MTVSLTVFCIFQNFDGEGFRLMGELSLRNFYLSEIAIRNLNFFLDCSVKIQTGWHIRLRYLIVNL